LSCKNEDFSKSCFDKPPTKQPAFQIHVDEPDGACIKKQVAETLKEKLTVESSPVVISNAVARLRQPLATIDIPSAMDVSFGRSNSIKTISYAQVLTGSAMNYLPQS